MAWKKYRYSQKEGFWLLYSSYSKLRLPNLEPYQKITPEIDDLPKKNKAKDRVYNKVPRSRTNVSDVTFRIKFEVEVIWTCYP